MNPRAMLPRLTALFGPELAEVFVKLAEQHKSMVGGRRLTVPVHIFVLLLEAACEDRGASGTSEPGAASEQ